MTYSCWLLSDQSRDVLLDAFPPKFPDVIAHHVTVKNPSTVAPEPAEITVLGQIVDPTGVQVLIVEVKIDDNVITRSDTTFHLTWSIDRSTGKKPFSSVDTIKRLYDSDFTPHDPIAIETTPAVC
jgi:hypothetical protein